MEGNRHLERALAVARPGPDRGPRRTRSRSRPLHRTLNRNTVADLELLVSELANSVEHGRGTIQLTVEHSVAAIQGSVTDDGDVV